MLIPKAGKICGDFLTVTSRALKMAGKRLPGCAYRYWIRQGYQTPGGISNFAHRDVKLYLDASIDLSPGPVAKESKPATGDDEQGKATFTIRPQDTELTGFMKLRLWVEADGADDMDLFVYVEKLDEQGNLLSPMVLGHPCPGAQGMLRVSHRELDEEKSTPYKPYLSHRQEQLLHDGEIVPVDIEIWPMGMIWHKGQQLRLTIQGLVNRG